MSSLSNGTSNSSLPIQPVQKILTSLFCISEHLNLYAWSYLHRAIEHSKLTRIVQPLPETVFAPTLVEITVTIGAK